MENPNKKVDMVQMNAAIDKVLAVPVAPKAKVKARPQRKAERPTSARSGKTEKQPAGR